MPITSNTLISDSFNFFKNQLNGLLFLSFISANIGIILYYFLVPIDEMTIILKTISSQNNSTEFLTWATKLSDKEKMTIIKVSILSLTTIFIGLILLVSSVVTYLLELTIGNSISAFQAFVLSLRISPNILILLFICTIIIYFGFILFIFPGIILAVGFSLSPIVLIIRKNISPLRAISKSWRISFQYWWLILLILLFCTLSQILVTMLFEQFHFLPNLINNIISFTLNNLLTSFALICFFRIYMLIEKITN
ncbi:MAG: YciC family protein [Arsenophonus sp.]